MGGRGKGGEEMGEGRTGVKVVGCYVLADRKSTRLNSSHMA